MHRVTGVVQHYAWGDREAIPELLRVAPDGRPWAELWLGTHHGGAATLDDGRALADVSGELPYMLKLLAADQPLSLQTHPDAATAMAGFERENAAGIALDAHERTYRDPFAKPELLVAITPFDALCGFRSPARTAELLRMLSLGALARQVVADGLEPVVAGIYRGQTPVGPIVAACASRPGPEADLVRRLDAEYPGEPSVAVTLFLNRVSLLPGEAIYLTPGNLHAYLRGTALEVMGASDNVVRGGLTRKHVDVGELLRVLRIEPLVDPVVVPRVRGDGSWRYPTPGAPFDVSRVDADGERSYVAEGRTVLLCTEGDAGSLKRGEVVYLQAGERVLLHGPSTTFAVSAP